MSIPDMWEKIKVFAEKEEFIHGILVFTVILLGLAGFGLGKMSQNEDIPVKIIYGNSSPEKDMYSNSPEASGIFASKNGTKYYLPGCSGAGNIKEENKIVFSSEADALSAGYSKASGCN